MKNEANMQHGHLIEQIVGDFNSKYFMKDFVFLNPKYFRGTNHREICDLLLVLNDKCIVISIKSPDGRVKTDSKFRSWLVKETKKGAKQADGGVRWASKVSFVGRNLWDENRVFQPNELCPICGITLLECSQQPFGSIEYPFILPESKVPLHVLSVNDFLNVATWLGSIWDVFDYFSKRADVSKSFTGINQEQSLLSYYTLVSKEFNGFPSHDKEKLSAMHHIHMAESLARYDDRNRHAHYVNSIINELHTRHPTIEEFMPSEYLKHVQPTETRSGYLQMSALLNSLPMSTKAYIGKEIEDRLQFIRDSGKGSVLAIKPLPRSFVFVFALFSQLSRTERIRRLNPMLKAALFQHGVNDGLGVGIDADNLETGFDLMLIRNHSQFTDKDKQLGAYLFPTSTDPICPDPFGNARTYSPK